MIKEELLRVESFDRVSVRSSLSGFLTYRGRTSVDESEYPCASGLNRLISEGMSSNFKSDSLGQSKPVSRHPYNPPVVPRYFVLLKILFYLIFEPSPSIGHFSFSTNLYLFPRFHSLRVPRSVSLCIFVGKTRVFWDEM